MKIRKRIYFCQQFSYFKLLTFLLVCFIVLQCGGSQFKHQKQPFRDVVWKRCSENMQQIYRRTHMPKCDFNKVARQECSPLNLLRIFGTLFPKNTTRGLLLMKSHFGKNLQHIFRTPFCKNASGGLLLKHPFYRWFNLSSHFSRGKFITFFQA